MTNLANKPPIGLKKSKPKKNPKYLDKIRSMPCCICRKFNEPQLSATTAHHPIHDRYSARFIKNHSNGKGCTEKIINTLQQV